MQNMGGIQVEGEIGVMGQIEKGMGDVEEGNGEEGKIQKEKIMKEKDEDVKLVREKKVDEMEIEMGKQKGDYKLRRKKDG